jgi:hypothetical protein
MSGGGLQFPAQNSTQASPSARERPQFVSLATPSRSSRSSSVRACLTADGQGVHEGQRSFLDLVPTDRVREVARAEDGGASSPREPRQDQARRERELSVVVELLRDPSAKRAWSLPNRRTHARR